MALIDCNECGKEISDEAKACPHCGKPLPKKVEKVHPIWTILVMIGIFYFLYSTLIKKTPLEERYNYLMQHKVIPKEFETSLVRKYANALREHGVCYPIWGIYSASKICSNGPRNGKKAIIINCSDKYGYNKQYGMCGEDHFKLIKQSLVEQYDLKKQMKLVKKYKL